MDVFLGYLLLVNKPVVVLLICAFAFAFILYKAHTAPNDFDLKDMIRNSKTKKADLFKFAQLVSLFTSTWIVMYLTTHDKLSEFAFGLYMIAWAGSVALDKYLSLKGGASPAEVVPSVVQSSSGEEVK